jgi:hypothetical protein
LSWQTPEPLHVSAASQAPVAGVPHAVPAGWNPLSWQAPERHVSWFVHAVPALPQLVPSATWLTWQTPVPLQESAASHAPDAELPHAVPAAWNPLSWHAPERQVSWLVHSVPASPQKVPSGLDTGAEQIPVDGLHVPGS